MARSRQKTTETDTSFNPAEFDPAMQPQAAEVVNQVAAATEMPDQPVTGHIANPSSTKRESGYASAETAPRKQWTPPPDPFGYENMKGEDNRVRLLKDEANGAWVIRFDKAPNEMEGHSKENPHPVIKMLKESGYRWGFGNDGKGGWGKAFEGDAYGQDHIEARKVLAKAAEMVGATLDQGRIPD